MLSCRTPARDVRGTIVDARPIARPVIDARTIDEPRTIEDRAAVTSNGSLDWPLDRIRYQWVVAPARALSRPLDRPFYRIGHNGVIAILI